MITEVIDTTTEPEGSTIGGTSQEPTTPEPETTTPQGSTGDATTTGKLKLLTAILKLAFNISECYNIFLDCGFAAFIIKRM